jgi:hypothetical protein
MAKKKNPLTDSPRKKRSYVGDFDDLMADISDEEPAEEEKPEENHGPTAQAASDEATRKEASESGDDAVEASAAEEEGSEPPKKHLNLKIDETLHTRFKGIVGMQGRTMTEVLEELMRGYVRESMQDLDL